MVGGREQPQVYALKQAAAVISVSVSVLCRSEFQVGPSPLLPGYPRAPRVPLHYPSAARRPHVSVLHLRGVLSDGCSAAGKPQTLTQKEPLRCDESKAVSRLNRTHGKNSNRKPTFPTISGVLPTKHRVSSVGPAILQGLVSCMSMTVPLV